MGDGRVIFLTNHVDFINIYLPTLHPRPRRIAKRQLVNDALQTPARLAALSAALVWPAAAAAGLRS